MSTAPDFYRLYPAIPVNTRRVSSHTYTLGNQRHRASHGVGGSYNMPFGLANMADDCLWGAS